MYKNRLYSTVRVKNIQIIPIGQFKNSMLYRYKRKRFLGNSKSTQTSKQ